MRQLCAHLDQLTSPVMRTAVELAIDTGRRPEEICELDFDCLARDEDGQPVLVYDNHKANRPGRRLPISERTAALIIAHQHRVRGRYSDTPVEDLKLLPTDRRNPGGRRAITASAWRSLTGPGWTGCRCCAPSTASSTTRPRSCFTPTGTATHNGTPTRGCPSRCCAS